MVYARCMQGGVYKVYIAKAKAYMAKVGWMGDRWQGRIEGGCKVGGLLGRGRQWRFAWHEQRAGVTLNRVDCVKYAFVAFDCSAPLSYFK